MGMIPHLLLALAGALAASVSMSQPPDTPVRMTAAPDRCADLAEKRDLGTLPLRKEPLVSRPAADGPSGVPLRPRVKPRKPAGLAFDIGRMPDLMGAYQWLPLDDDGDGMSNDVELALNRHPRLNEGALVSALVLALED